MILFWAVFHRLEKWSKSSKALPGGGVEIENITFYIFNIFNFSSATRWHFSTLTSLLPSIDPWSKKYHSDFCYMYIMAW